MSTDPPPPYTESTTPVSSRDADHQNSGDTSHVTAAAGANVTTEGSTIADKPAHLLPTYDDVTCVDKLPTYEEVQQQQHAVNANTQPSTAANVRVWQLPTVIDNLDSQQHQAHSDQHLSDDQILGTDLTFLAAFLVSFLFNWVGFLALLCFCQSVAARYGALAGFGLSLAKWTLIVKNNTSLVSHDNLWLWWLIMAFGLVICVRAMLQYFYIKREWQTLSDMTRRRLVLFY